MKKMTLIAAFTAAALTNMQAMAEQPMPAGKGAQVQQKAPNVSEFDKQMAQIQENMKKMQDEMDKIHQTKDPQTRQKLLKDHWSTMQNNMQMMEGMWGPDGCMGGGMGHDMMMGGHMMGWGDMDDYYSNLTSEQMKQRQYMMDRYMPMQQMMMDHIMRHQHEMGMQPA